MTNTKLGEIRNLAIKTKNGDKAATTELLNKFNPLIYKISTRIYYRYNGVFPLDEIVQQCKFSFIQLTVSQYKPDGQAHFPHFIQKMLLGHLISLYRPLHKLVLRSRPLEYYTPDLSLIDEICKNERAHICEELMRFIEDKCDEREKEIIRLYMCGSTPRNQLAIKYHVSAIRMKHIHLNLLRKLRKFLATLGVKRIEDI